MVKKGFTFIELAIILLIVGFILSISLKGSELLDEAKMRAELAKFDKIQTAVINYSDKYGKLPGNGVVSHQPLVKGGYIKEEDFKSAYLDGLEYELFTCSINPVDPKRVKDKNAVTGGYSEMLNGKRLCINAFIDIIDKEGMPPRIICQYEGRMDDDDSRTGIGRSSDGKGQILETSTYRKNCNKFSNSADDLKVYWILAQ